MPRHARIVVPGLAHHITQRGNNQQDVFYTSFDRKLFLEMLAKYASKHGLALWGYCLMPNHFHLIGLPEAPDSLAHTLGRLLADYARYLNTRRGKNGHLWQARYYSTPMDERYRWRALAYVERNPVRAGIASDAGAFPWSSAAARLGLSAAPDWLELSEWSRHWTPTEWSRLLAESFQERTFAKEIRDAALRGHPLGAALTLWLEADRGIRLRPAKAGRPYQQDVVTLTEVSSQARLFDETLN